MDKSSGRFSLRQAQGPLEGAGIMGRFTLLGQAKRAELERDRLRDRGAMRVLSMSKHRARYSLLGQAKRAELERDRLRDRAWGLRIYRDISLQMGAHSLRGGQEHGNVGRRREFWVVFIIN